ncbi:hypothetical protein GCM10009727_27600 [Actinomadura napierensis]|uniref:Ribosomal protein mS38 C-terminal domain-containing protein n=1 Tax=Actinomadura napierensis TaxID=267854 RepID=A0ABP5KRN2_9ACTN
MRAGPDGTAEPATRQCRGRRDGPPGPFRSWGNRTRTGRWPAGRRSRRPGGRGIPDAPRDPGPGPVRTPRDGRITPPPSDPRGKVPGITRRAGKRARGGVPDSVRHAAARSPPGQRYPWAADRARVSSDARLRHVRLLHNTRYAERGLVGSVIKKRRKRMAKKKHRKLLKKTRIQRRNKK